MEENKPTYEELENQVQQLQMQCKQFYQELQKANMNNLFKRLDYLFKIIENSDKFNRDFTDKIISEIENIITIPEESDQK